jgi:hypothetical protein
MTDNALKNKNSFRRLDALEALNIGSRLSSAESDIQSLQNRASSAEDRLDTNESDISNLELFELQKRTEEKLKRDAAFYADFTQDDAIVSSGLSKVASGVASAITLTNPDGITGIGADGNVYDSGVGNVPIVYDENGVCQGLQVAPSSTNEWLWSEDITQTSWNKAGATATDFEALTESSNNEVHRVDQSISVTSQGDLWSFHGEFKPNGRSVVQFVIGSNIFPTTYANFDLENGIVSASGSGIEKLNIKQRADGWYYCEVTLIATAGSGGLGVSWLIQNSPTASRFSSYQGDGVSGIKMRYLQSEQGYPTPYIKTEASQVTRGDVTASRQLTDILNSDRGSLYWAGVIPKQSDVAGIVAIGHSGTSIESAVTIIQRNDETLDFIIRTDGGTGSDTIATNIPFNVDDYNKIAFTYDFTTLIGQLSVNGVTYAVDSLVAKPSLFSGGNMSIIFGKYRRVDDPQFKLKTKECAYSSALLNQNQLNALTNLGVA